MRDDIVQALLAKVMGWRTPTEDQVYRPYLQSMAKYKYDDYQQFRPGMRFIESLAKWLSQFVTKSERECALQFVKERLIFISNQEMNHLVMAVFPDIVKKIIIERIAIQQGLPSYKIKQIVSSQPYKVLKRQCLFLGLSDGSKTEIFRRSNTDEISHEQVYQTYELSTDRASKMQNELREDLKNLLGRMPTEEECKYKIIFLLDDFSGSGRSYIRNEEGVYKGKIASIYKGAQKDDSAYSILMDISKVEVNLILYLCTSQAYEYIDSLMRDLWHDLYPKPKIWTSYKFRDEAILNNSKDSGILQICENDSYYDKKKLEDKHTAEGGGGVKYGFGACKLPLVLNHNTPNNSISLLWAYDDDEIIFKGLFPRIPRHKELL